LIASTPALTADPASFTTSVATWPTRAMGAGTRGALFWLLVDFPLAALRVDAVAPRLLVEEVFVFGDAERFADMLRDVPEAEADAAERPRDFVLLRFFFPALRDEALLLDFPRDFLALVAIAESPRSRLT